MRKSLIGLTFLLLALFTTSLAFTASASATSPTLKQLKVQLHRAQTAHSRAQRGVLAAMADVALAEALRVADSGSLAAGSADAQAGTKDQLAAALLADGVVSDDELAALKAKEDAARQTRKHWALKVKRLKQQVKRKQQIVTWNHRGSWTPLINLASKRYGVSAVGLKRLMMLESGGNRHAGTTFKGLFQYYPGTWRGTWNPWRARSIYDGWAQIRATAYAIHRGMGPSSWPNTYWRAF